MAASGGKKLGKLVKGMKKTVEKVIHPPFLKTNIPAGQASPAPPLGSQLGQVRQWLLRLIRALQRSGLAKSRPHILEDFTYLAPV